MPKAVHIPAHDKGTSDPSWAVLRCKNRDCRAFQTHTNAHEKASNEELRPCLGQRTADRCQEHDHREDEDSASTSQVIIARVGQPAADESGSDIRPGIDGTDQPVVTHMVRRVWLCAITDTELDWETEIGSVGPRKRQIIEDSTKFFHSLPYPV